ncbi:Hypp6566 [Branchiostoma lanceolatum]|uniref:Hypp6566 protein n=1 Tax=Branchiostoma lanceolatum TaxID=7740 RepID=A0A8K0E761_BRALA|nr:Hypp6566 [Branchiostoma lanceolatum]
MWTTRGMGPLGCGGQEKSHVWKSVDLSLELSEPGPEGRSERGTRGIVVTTLVAEDIRCVLAEGAGSGRYAVCDGCRGQDLRAEASGGPVESRIMRSIYTVALNVIFSFTILLHACFGFPASVEKHVAHSRLQGTMLSSNSSGASINSPASTPRSRDDTSELRTERDRLCLCFSRSREHGTMCGNMNVIKANNAKKGPHKDFNSFREFVDKDTDEMILTCTMEHFGMETMEDLQKKTCFPANIRQVDKTGLAGRASRPDR